MSHSMSRRQILLGGLVLAGASTLGACTKGASTTGSSATTAAGSTTATTTRLAAPAVTKSLTAKPISIDIGGIEAKTWGYVAADGEPAIDIKAGEVLQVDIKNELPESTSIHWHGVALEHGSDGVPQVTQKPIEPGESYQYQFVVPDGGTYFYHSHSGLQLERGLNAPLIVRDPQDKNDHDVEWTIMLDDWLDGIDGKTPEHQLEMLTGMAAGDHNGMHKDAHGHMHSSDHAGMAMGNGGASMAHGTPDPQLGGDAGDVMYPYYLINGRIPSAHHTFQAQPGNKARLRFINAGGDTIFKVALGDHRMTVTHIDGHPVRPQDVESFYIAMGERVDVEVTLGDGAFPLTALAVGKNDRAFAVVRTAGGQAPEPTVSFPELESVGTFLTAFEPADRARLPKGEPVREVSVGLTGQMMPYEWGMTIDGGIDPIIVKEGERIRMVMHNDTAMPHPMHIHGHTWALPDSNGLRKDTVLIRTGETVVADLLATNPGQWSFHCHNDYHMGVGMMNWVNYQ
ncbi:MAG: multicopper oxidase family protein [Corynebacterium sp.]|nr:multicopper oxidase family protein [Corynebacterium sp.]